MADHRGVDEPLSVVEEIWETVRIRTLQYYNVSLTLTNLLPDLHQPSFSIETMNFFTIILSFSNFLYIYIAIQFNQKLILNKTIIRTWTKQLIS